MAPAFPFSPTFINGHAPSSTECMCVCVCVSSSVCRSCSCAIVLLGVLFREMCSTGTGREAASRIRAKEQKREKEGTEKDLALIYVCLLGCRQ